MTGANVGQARTDGPVKLGDFSSKGSRYIPQRSRRIRHFRTFLNFDNCQPEAVSGVISGKADQDVGMDVCANFGDSRSNRSRDIRQSHFVTNDDDDDNYDDDAGRRTL